MKPFKVTVTKTDIQKGEAMDCEKCPIARATLRDCRVATKVAVTSYFINVYKEGNLVARMEMPKKCERFIERFDGGEKVKPFTFVFRNNGPLPTETI